MSLSLSEIHCSRYAEPAAWVCCAALTLISVWLLVSLVWALVPRGDAAFDTTPPRTGGAAGSSPAQSIAKWHVFGSTPLAGDAAPNASLATLSLILRGTVAANDPSRGIAVISDSKNGERAYRVGDFVTSNARLGGVFPDHVVLSTDGTEEVLKLSRDRNLEPGNIVQPTPATTSSRTAASNPFMGSESPDTASTHAADGSASAAAGSETPGAASARALDFSQVMRRVQVVPVLDGVKLAGVRLAGVDAQLARFGLRPGDVLTSVNGTPIDSFERAQEIISGVGNAKSVHAIVLRNGTPTQITVGLQ